MMKLGLAVYLLSLLSAFAQEDLLYSTQSSWIATTTNSQWLSRNREKLLTGVDSAYRTGVVQSVVLQGLGDPQSIWQEKDKTIWTYGLHRRLFFHVVLDHEGRVVDTVKTGYVRFSDDQLCKMTNFTDLTSNSILDIASWRAVNGLDLKTFDRSQMAAGAARCLHPDMFNAAVECVFGKPEFITNRQEQGVWTYRIGASTFLQIIFLDNKYLLGAHVRHYNGDNGRLNLIPLCGVLEKPEAVEFDEACWRASFSKYKTDNIRTGIGTRMASYVKPGMSEEKVCQLLGAPHERNKQSDSISYTYYTSPASWVFITFNSDGRVENVKLAK